MCRKKFNKLGKDLEIAKGKDRERYYKLLGQLKESYHQCGSVCFYLEFRMNIDLLLNNQT